MRARQRYLDRYLYRYGFSLMGLLALANAAMADGPDPSQVFITGASYAGTGCPEGTASVTLTPDAKTLSVLFDQFTVQAGKGATPQHRKDCDVRVGFSIPPGWSMSLFSVDFRGYARLDKKTNGTHAIRYSFDGASSPPYFSLKALKAPTDANYLIHNDLPFTAISWSACDAGSASLTISSAITAIAAADRTALLTVDSLDGELKQLYGVRWKKCPKPGENERVPLYRYLHGTGQNDRGRLISTSPSDSYALNLKFRLEGFAFNVYRSAGEGLVPLYNCRNNDFGGHVVLRQEDCQGQIQLGMFGYVRAEPAEGFVPVYRFHSKKAWYDNLITTNRAEGAPGKYDFIEVLGYAPLQ
jgi:hypothetical protein